MPDTASLACVLSSAIADVRRRAGSAMASVAVLAPTRANAQYLARTLVSAGPWMRVTFETPDSLMGQLGRLRMLAEGRRPEPPGWLEASVIASIDAMADELGELGATLQRPAWIPALTESLRALERGRVSGAVLDALQGDDVAPRARLLARLLEAIERARLRDGFVGEDGILASAQDAITRGEIPRPATFDGFVVVGDGVLGYGVFAALRDYLARRPAAVLAIAPMAHLAPAPLGLRLAAGAVPEFVAEAGAPGALGHLQGALFTSTAVAKDPDPSVVFASTADEVREVNEAVRVVQDAIAQRTPLDRIAIALPDAATVDVLREALARAQIPAIWLVGPPLAQTTSAKFLMLALEMAQSPVEVATWYRLLNIPGVLSALRAASPRDEISWGTGRWRRLLSRTRVARGTDALLAALSARDAELAELRALPADAGDEGSVLAQAAAEGHASGTGYQAEREAIAALMRCMEMFAADLATLPTAASIHAHARAWRALVERYQSPSAELNQLIRLLDDWSVGEAGPTLGREHAHALLASTLEATQALSGTLSDRALRVVPPMALVGAELDLVCLLGLNEGRFPRGLHEDPLLPDVLIAACNAHLNETRLVPSGHLEDAERRRFGAAIGAATKQLWLSVPHSDLMSARPSVPGTLVLEAASALLGRRATYGALHAMMVRVGSRDRFAPEQRERAITLSEDLIADLDSRDDEGDSARANAALGRIARHPTARRLMQLYRSIDKLHGVDHDGVPAHIDAWSGSVPPGSFAHPALTDAPCDPRILAQAWLEPSAYFFRYVLGAWRPAWLGDARGPSEGWTIARWTRQAMEAALDSGEPDVAKAFDAALDKLVTSQAATADGDARAELEIARSLARSEFDRMDKKFSDGLADGPRESLEGLPVGGDVPWRLSGMSDFVGKDGLIGWDEEKKLSASSAKLGRLLLQGLAIASRSNSELPSVELRSVADASSAKNRADMQAVRERVEASFARIRAGFWPVEAKEFRLHSEPAWSEAQAERQRAELYALVRDPGVKSSEGGQ